MPGKGPAQRAGVPAFQARNASQIDVHFPRIESALLMEPGPERPKRQLRASPTRVRGQFSSLIALPTDAENNPLGRLDAASIDDDFDYGGRPHPSEQSPSLLGTEIAPTMRDPSVADYELLLQDNLNLENLQNKLYVKKNLIAQAVGRPQPKRRRMFAGDVVTQLKEM